MENRVIIFTAPSGSGKSTIVQNILKNGSFELSVSDTTRDKRSYEVDGKHYNFVSTENFKNSIKDDSFIEYEEVYDSQFYGTRKSSVYKIWERGKIAIFDVDVKGALKLKEYFGKKALSIFIKVPSVEVLKKRLYLRGTESDESLRKRVGKFEEELEYTYKFDYVLINDILEDTLKVVSKDINKWIGIQ